VQNSNYSKVDRWLLGANAMPKPLGWYLRYWGPSFRKFCDLVQIWTKSQNFLTKRPSIGTKKEKLVSSLWALDAWNPMCTQIGACYFATIRTNLLYSTTVATYLQVASEQFDGPFLMQTHQGGCMFCEVGTALGLVRTCHTRCMHLPAFCMD